MNSENQFWEDLESGKVVSVVKESSKGRALSSSKKLMKIRQELRECIRNTLPSKEFGATMILAMVGLHMTEAELQKTQNIIERRRLISEFKSRRDAIKKGIRLLRQSNGKNRNNSKETLKRAVS
jgi:hypothetical protein